MDLTEAKSIIAGGESETVEFKKSSGQLKKACETLCAFLNTSGGQVFIGVTQDGRIVGQTVSDTTQQDIANEIKKIEPSVPIISEYISVGKSGLRLIVLEAVPSAEHRPYVFDGKPFMRRGTSTQRMPQGQYQQQLLNRTSNSRRWETAVATNVRLEELDKEQVLRTARQGISAGRLPETTVLESDDILERLSILVDGKLLNAAVVLFGTKFEPAYPQCRLRMARFKGLDKSEFMDNRMIHGHGFLLLEEAMLFLQRHLPIAGRVQKNSLERVDEPLIPLEALREALVNAICHRDYTIPGGAISLAIYDDRLEIWNDGTLPRGLNVEDLKKDHISIPPNPTIANVFYRRGLIEMWGRGTQKIVMLCVESGRPEPDFLVQAGAVGVRFAYGGYYLPRRGKLDLTSRQKEIIQILSVYQTLPFRRIKELMANPPADRTIRKDLSLLKKKGFIDFKGRGASAVWFFTGDFDLR